MGQNSNWQFTAALMIALVVFGGGTMAAVILGRPIPDALWAIDGVLANTMVAHAGFFTQRAQAREGMASLTEAMRLHAAAIAPLTTTTITPGETRVATGGAN
jgi:hypothetical protein